MIPRGALPIISLTRGLQYDSAPDELKPTILVLARLKHATANAGKETKTPGKVGRKFKGRAA